MKKYLLIALFGLLWACTTSNIPANEIIENSISDTPAKSQVLIRLELTGTYTPAQVKELCEMMVRISSDKTMKYHPKPTHIWVYIYKSKADFEKDGGSWIAMYGKAGSDEPGEFTYR